MIDKISEAPPGFRFGGGDILGGRPRRGSGGGAPRTPENFENFQTISQENCKKWIILGDFSKKLKNPCVKFSRFGRKTQLCGEFLRKFSKISLKKAQKMHYFGLFSKKFQNPALNFRAF